MGVVIQHGTDRLSDAQPEAASQTQYPVDFAIDHVSSARSAVIEARKAGLDPAVRASIEELVDEAGRGFDYLRKIRTEDPHFPNHFWICGSARTIPPASPALGQLAEAVVGDSNISTAEALARFPIGVAEVNAAIKERNLGIMLENRVRLSQGRTPLPLYDLIDSLDELKTELGGFREGIDLPRAFGSPDFTSGVLTAEIIADDGYGVVSGGGPGQMMAGNKGAFSHGGSSIGFSIKLPHEEAPNEYTPRQFKCKYFVIRKKLLLECSNAAIITGGGLGTIEEYLQILCAGMAAGFMPKEYWEKQLFSIEKQLSKHGFDSSRLKTHTLLTDSRRECVDFAKAHQLKRTTWTVEQVENLKNSIHDDLVNAFHALAQFNPTGAKVVTVFAPDIPGGAQSPGQFIQAVTELCSHYQKRGCKVMFAGHSDLAAELLRCFPENPPLILKTADQAGGPDSSGAVTFQDEDIMHHFMRSAASLYAVLPGGLRSPFRCFEMLCLLQNKKISGDKGLVLAIPRGTSDYWPGIISTAVDQASMKPYHLATDVLYAGAVFQLKLGPSAGWVSGPRCIEVG